MSVESLEPSFVPDSNESERRFDRTPPQDLAAEQSVLGGMLMSKDAIADVIAQIKSTDFYKPAHESIFNAIIDLYGKRTEKGDLNCLKTDFYKNLITMVFRKVQKKVMSVF